MRCHVVILLLITVWLSARAQIEGLPPVGESDYGVVRTNVNASYDHTFGAVPDNFTSRISYRLLNLPFLSVTVNSRFNTLWSNLKDSQLEPEEDAWGSGLNGSHTYGSFGFTALGFLPPREHPVAVMLQVNSEYSSHCFGRISGLAGAVCLFKLTPDTQLGAGAVFIIHTSSSVPVLPMIIFRHRFNPRLALGIYGGLFNLDYNLDTKSVLSLNGTLDTRSFYFKPHVEYWPEKCRFTMTLFRAGVRYKREVALNIFVEAEAGVAFKTSGRVTSATKSHAYMKFHERPASYLKASVSWSL